MFKVNRYRVSGHDDDWTYGQTAFKLYCAALSYAKALREGATIFDIKEGKQVWPVDHADSASTASTNTAGTARK